MAQRIEIKKGFLGRYTIYYQCPQCQTALNSPLKDAGNRDSCPACSSPFVVPGSDEQNRIQSEESRRATEKSQAIINEEEQKRKREQEKRREAMALSALQKVEGLRVAEPQRQVQSMAENRRMDQSLASSEQLRRCPYCAEEIQVAAKKCKHCGEFLDGNRTAPANQTQSQESSGCSQVIIIAFGIILAIILLALL